MRQNEHYKCGGHMEGYFIARKMRLILREMVKAQKRGDATGFMMRSILPMMFLPNMGTLTVSFGQERMNDA